MGLNENVTYNNYERKGTLQGHSGSSQRKESRSSFPWAPPKLKTKTKHTKRNSRFQKQKQKNSDAPSWSQNQPHGSNCASCSSTFSCLSALGPGTLQMEPTRFYCLKKSDSLPQAAPPSWAKASQRVLNFRTFRSSVTPPHSQTHEYTVMNHLFTNHKFVNIHFLLASSHSV